VKVSGKRYFSMPETFRVCMDIFAQSLYKFQLLAIEKTKNFIIQNADRYKYGNAAMLSKMPNIPSVDRATHNIIK
jgi:hypothetical protein